MKPRRLQSATISSSVTSVVVAPFASAIEAPRLVDRLDGRRGPSERFATPRGHASGRIFPPIEGALLGSRASTGQFMLSVVTTPIRAGRHLAIWIVWHSTGVTLVPARRS